VVNKFALFLRNSHFPQNGLSPQTRETAFLNGLLYQANFPHFALRKRANLAAAARTHAEAKRPHRRYNMSEAVLLPGRTEK
jgi:hypothetical protein